MTFNRVDVGRDVHAVSPYAFRHVQLALTVVDLDCADRHVLVYGSDSKDKNIPTYQIGIEFDSYSRTFLKPAHRVLFEDVTTPFFALANQFAPEQPH